MEGGIWLISFGLWHTADDASKRVSATSSESPVALTNDTTVAVVMAAAAAEAFINELAYLLRRLKSPHERWRACTEALSELEAERAPTTLKYLVASLTLTGKMFDRGQQPFQDLSDLMKLRNAIMHLDPSGPPGVYKRFLRTPLSYSHQGTDGLHWLLDVQTEKMARWACDAAFNIACATRDMVPEWPFLRKSSVFADYWVR